MKPATKFVIVLLGVVLLMDFGASEEGGLRNLVKRSAQGPQGGPPMGGPGGQGPPRGGGGAQGGMQGGMGASAGMGMSAGAGAGAGGGAGGGGK